MLLILRVSLTSAENKCLKYQLELFKFLKQVVYRDYYRLKELLQRIIKLELMELQAKKSKSDIKENGDMFTGHSGQNQRLNLMNKIVYGLK